MLTVGCCRVRPIDVFGGSWRYPKPTFFPPRSPPRTLPQTDFFRWSGRYPKATFLPCPSVTPNRLFLPWSFFVRVLAASAKRFRSPLVGLGPPSPMRLCPPAWAKLGEPSKGKSRFGVTFGDACQRYPKPTFLAWSFFVRVPAKPSETFPLTMKRQPRYVATLDRGGGRHTAPIDTGCSGELPRHLN